MGSDDNENDHLGVVWLCLTGLEVWLSGVFESDLEKAKTTKASFNLFLCSVFGNVAVWL